MDRIAEIQEAIEYLNDKRFAGIIAPFLRSYVNSQIEMLCRGNNDGDIRRGEIKAYRRILNLRQELSDKLASLTNGGVR